MTQFTLSHCTSSRDQSRAEGTKSHPRSGAGSRPVSPVAAPITYLCFCRLSNAGEGDQGVLLPQSDSFPAGENGRAGLLSRLEKKWLFSLNLFALYCRLPTGVAGANPELLATAPVYPPSIHPQPEGTSFFSSPGTSFAVRT